MLNMKIKSIKHLYAYTDNHPDKGTLRITSNFFFCHSFTRWLVTERKKYYLQDRPSGDIRGPSEGHRRRSDCTERASADSVNPM